MLDFSKLNDPVVRAEMAAERAAHELAQAAQEKKVSDAIILCEEHVEELSSQELSFLNSLKVRVRIYSSPPSEKQLKWLNDIAQRFSPDQPQLDRPRSG